MTALAVIAGLVIGLFADEVWGSLLGGLIGFAVARILLLSQQVKRLQFQVLELEQAQHESRVSQASAQADGLAVDTVQGAPLETPAADGAAGMAATVAVESPLWTGDSATTGGAAEPVASQASPFDPATAATASPIEAVTGAPVTADKPPAPPRPSFLAPLWTWLVGGNTIVKAGIGILFIGLAFLAKYASEQVSVPVELRLAGVAFAAIVLMVVGWRLRLRRPAYAQVLQGGAVAVLYLTLFVALRMFGVLAAGPAFGLMLLVAAFSAALAVLQNARSLAVVGALGGFATPLLTSTGGGNIAALFGLYLLLDLGIAAVAWHRTWRSLNGVGFAFTFGVAAVWGLTSYRSADYGMAQAFLIAFFLLFVAVLLMPARRRGGAAIDGDLTGHDDAEVRDASSATSSIDNTQSSVTATPPTLVDRLDRWVDSSLLFGLPTIVFALQYGLVRDTAYGTALSALVLAAFYVGLASWLRRRTTGLAFEGALAVGVVFITLVVPFALDASSTAGAWALEGAGLVWIGFRQQQAQSRGFGYALIVIAGAALGRAYDHSGPITTLFSGPLLGTLLLAAGSLIAALQVSRHAVRPLPVDVADIDVNVDVSASGSSPNVAPEAVAGMAAASEPAALASDLPAAEPAIAPSRNPRQPRPPLSDAFAEWPLIGWACLWLLVASGVHIEALVKESFWLTASLAVASLLALVFTELSVRLRWTRIAIPACVQAPFLLFGVAVAAVFNGSAMAFGGWWAWPLSLVVHLWVLRRAAPQWPPRLAAVVHGLGLLVIAWLGALQGSAITRSFGDTEEGWRWLGWFVVPAALLGLMARSATARLWPVRASPSAYRLHAAAVLAFGLLAWTLLANAFSTGSARPLPYVPLLNPLDLGIGATLLAVLAWWHQLIAPASGRGRFSVAVLALLGLGAFAWLNAMLLRSFFHYGGVPYDLDTWAENLAVQSGLTLLWTLTALALMWLSARRGWRSLWLVGAALLGLVVVKLLVVDLSGSGTVARIVSFIGAGVVMLVIGYVAPLPSKAVVAVAAKDADASA